MTIFAKDKIDVQQILQKRPTHTNKPPGQHKKIQQTKKKRHKKQSGYKGVARGFYAELGRSKKRKKVENYICLCLGPKAKRQLRQRNINTDIQSVST